VAVETTALQKYDGAMCLLLFGRLQRNATGRNATPKLMAEKEVLEVSVFLESRAARAGWDGFIN
jgi:hypothetical protein